MARDYWRGIFPESKEETRRGYSEELERVAESFDGIDARLFTQSGDAGAALEIARYLVWLGRIGHEGITGEQLAVLAMAGIWRGRWWSEVCEDVGLPVPPEWE